ncbi:MAG: hypothetical protein H6737_03525 [Alphaproteobacteria bacterium]|nr:hypothetical protein [Alphaproteobacteria bacterium]
MVLLLATAFANPLFNGAWTLDPKASESMGAILGAQGLSWIERTLAESGTPTHTIEWSEDRATVYVQSGWYRRIDEHPLDGVARSVAYPRIGAVDVSAEMRGDVLYTRGDLTLRDGRPGILESFRELADAETLVMTMRFTSPDGEVLEAKRVFRRE